MIGERVLRPAMVGVSKGGPKTAPASRAVNDNATADAGKDSLKIATRIPGAAQHESDALCRTGIV